jgi:Holliday junction resolvasome RuvABC endonuclease subunit
VPGSTSELYLGIDQSLTGTGLCVIDNDARVRVLATVDTKNLRGGIRLAKIRDAVVDVLTEGPISGAAVEGYSMGSINRPFDLGEVGGVIRLALTDARVSYNIVAPSVLKLFATGHGHADKARMLREAETRGACPADDNQADAYFLACVARAVSRGASQPHELRALRTVTTPRKRRRNKPPRRLVPAAI